MATLQETIQAKIIDVQTRAAAEISQYQADLAAINTANPTFLQTEVETLKVWFQSVKNHLEGL